MRANLVGLAAAVVLAGGLVAAAPSPDDGAKQPFYSVAVYNPSRDPNADLAATVARATREDKRILLVVGGDWCIWCKILERFIDDTPAVAAALAERYLVMKVDHADDGRNGEFLAGYPEAAGYPHFYVLASDGALLHSQDTVLLEQGESYGPEAFLAFLAQWR